MLIDDDLAAIQRLGPTAWYYPAARPEDGRSAAADIAALLARLAEQDAEIEQERLNARALWTQADRLSTLLDNAIRERDEELRKLTSPESVLGKHIAVAEAAESFIREYTEPPWSKEAGDAWEQLYATLGAAGYLNPPKVEETP